MAVLTVSRMAAERKPATPGEMNQDATIASRPGKPHLWAFNFECLVVSKFPLIGKHCVCENKK